MHTTSAPTNTRKALVYCADDNVLPFALFSARNAALHAPSREYDIVICSLAPLHIPQEFTDLGIKTEVIDIADELSSLQMAEKWLPETAFLRLWLSQHLGDRYDLILYLDSDTNVVNDQISHLFSVDFSPHPIAAVRDVAQWINLNRNVMDFKERKIRGQKYFNSGVQLIHTRRFREMGCLEKMLIIHNAPEPTLQNDQSLLNLGLLGHIAELHPAWNWQWTNREPFLSHVMSPNIVHYVGWTKPWSEKVFQKSRYSYDLYWGYRSFINQHFPDRMPGFPKLEKPPLTYWKTLGWFCIQWVSMLALYRYLRRFKSELDVLT